MIRAIFWMGIGAVAFFLYQNPGEFDRVADEGRKVINSGATIIKDATDANDLEDALQGLRNKIND